jgi:hypothetical protein
MKSELMAMYAHTLVSITRDATRSFGIFCFFVLLLLLLFRSCIDDGGIDLLELPEAVNAGYAAIAIANIALRNVLPANHVCGIKYLRKRNSSIKV